MAEAILNKPETLTPDETLAVQAHPVIGERILNAHHPKQAGAGRNPRAP